MRPLLKSYPMSNRSFGPSRAWLKLALLLSVLGAGCTKDGGARPKAVSGAYVGGGVGAVR